MIVQTVGTTCIIVQIVDEIPSTVLSKSRTSVQIYHMIDDITEALMEKYKNSKYAKNRMKLLYSEQDQVSILCLEFETDYKDGMINKKELHELEKIVNSMHVNILAAINNINLFAAKVSDLCGTTASLIDEYEKDKESTNEQGKKAKSKRTMRKKIQDVSEKWRSDNLALFRVNLYPASNIKIHDREYY